jgi:hypothetical protein
MSHTEQEFHMAEPTGFAEVVRAGVTIASLEAMRDQIAADLELCEAMRDKAALYLRLADVLRTLEELRPETVKGDAVDEIAARRASRRAGTAKGSARPKRSG